MKEHVLFPTLLAEFEYPDKDNFKQIFYDKIFNYMSPDGFSNEYTGHVNLHHEPAFESLFKFAIDSVRQYVSRLYIDPNVFEFNLVKTWMNITKNRQTPMHSHGDAHMSFTYYINIPKDFSKPIRFYNYEHRYEPFPGCIKFNNPSHWDAFNAYTWQLEPKEGQLFVFPSNVPHDTVGQSEQMETGCFTPNDLDQMRICLAADILMTYKERAAKPLGVQPVSNWRTF